MTLRAAVVVALAGVLFGGAPAWAKKHQQPTAPCRVLFTEVNITDVPADLTPAQLKWYADHVTLREGLTVGQISWYRKHGDRGRLAGICFSTMKENPDFSPFYIIMYVDGVYQNGYDIRGKHIGPDYRGFESGVLERYDKFDMPPIPISSHNTTIFTDVSVSLLKDALEKIEQYESKRLGQ